MNFEPALEEGVLIRRYKRFLADIIDAQGVEMTIHCPNTGAMLGCADPGSRIWYSTSDNPKRKYPHSLELVLNSEKHLVGVNSAFANALVEEALVSGLIEELRGYTQWQREVAIPLDDEEGRRGRFDFALSADPAGEDQQAPCYVEVKSLTLLLEDSLGAFPDAPSERAQKHVQALARLVQQGHRCVLLFCVQHSGVEEVTVAEEIDPEYAESVRSARALGVEVLAYTTEISPGSISISHSLPVSLNSF